MLTVFTPREVAALSGATKASVEKAIEEKVLAPHRARRGGRERRVLPAFAVAYSKIVRSLKYRMDLPMKRRLASKLLGTEAADLASLRFELEPAVEMDVGRLVGDAMVRAETYGAARDRLIVEDPEVLGGTAVLRGTRLSVYSIGARLADGDAVEDLIADYPDLSPEAIEAAVIYAATHPLVGRPGGRPWTAVA